MAEIEETTPPPPQQQPATVSDITTKFDKLSIPSTFTIWPPTQRTRDAVINRLIETLSQPSILSKRYGSLPPEEAATTAKSIEDEAFVAATESAGSGEIGSVDDGIEILQVYSKEISMRMLEKVKSRGVRDGNSAASETVSVAVKEEEVEEAEKEDTEKESAADVSEEVSSAEPES